MDATATACTRGGAQVFDLHAMKAFAPDGRVRKPLFSAKVMDNVERCDKTLPRSEMIFCVRRDAARRARRLRDLEALTREFGLSREEYEAVRDRDVRRLTGLVVRPGAKNWHPSKRPPVDDRSDT